MRLVDLTVEFAELVRGAHGTIEFKARFWGWLEAQRREGPLAPLLGDMERHWSTIGSAPSLSEARDLVRRLAPGGHGERVATIAARFDEIVGESPDVPVILLAGLERPEGYSRFDEGRNTIFVGLDHPSSLSHADHLELILSHESCHAVRDTDPAVLADYGGVVEMTHDDFVARYPFREHLLSEALATSISERCYPGRPDRRYVYFDEEAVLWCEEHRRVIAERMVAALERAEPYRTFYAEESVAPGSPDCVDYWFGLQLGRFLLGRRPAGELLRTPSTAILDRELGPFRDEFLAGERPRERAGPRAAVAQGDGSLRDLAADEALDGASLPREVRRVYRRYASLLARRPALARQAEEQVASLVGRERLDYGGAPWEVHAFPLLLSDDELRHLRWATGGLMAIVERAIEMFRTDREVRGFFRFPRHLELLAMLEPGYRPQTMIARLDSYWSGRRVRFLEINVNGASGWALSELLAEEALRLPGLGDVLQRHGAQAAPLVCRLLDGILSAWYQARGEGVEPRRIAIVDWPGLPTRSELGRLAADFARIGVATSVVGPAELRLEGSTLSCAEGPIDVVYRRLTTLDLIDRSGELELLVEAARRGAAVTVASYGSDVAHSKRLFAFLTDERWARRFSPEERALIDAHVPWTRLFIPSRTQFEGRLWDLRELALAGRERFVLKPTEGFEGRGVLLGAETEPGPWKAEVERRYGGDHVLQRRVEAPLRRLLVPHEDRVEEVSRWLHLGEFVVEGQLAGFLARASEELVLGEDSHERTLPCLTLTDGTPAEGEEEGDLGPASP